MAPATAKDGRDPQARNIDGPGAYASSAYAWGSLSFSMSVPRHPEPHGQPRQHHEQLPPPHSLLREPAVPLALGPPDEVVERPLSDSGARTEPSRLYLAIVVERHGVPPGVGQPVVRRAVALVPVEAGSVHIPWGDGATIAEIYRAAGVVSGGPRIATTSARVIPSRMES